MTAAGLNDQLLADWHRNADGDQWVCRLCNDNRYRHRFHIVQHEGTNAHQAALRRFELEAANQGNPIHSMPPLEYDGVNDTRTAFHIFVEDGVRNLTYSMSRPPDSNTSTIPIAPSNTLIDWNLYEARQDDIELNIYDPQETVRAIAAELYARLDESPPSDDEDNAEWSDSDIEPDDVEEPTGDCKQSNYRRLTKTNLALSWD